MGIADVIPGVSGGTMAFILGIYARLLDAIKSFNISLLKLLLGGKFKEALASVPWRFLLALGSGIGTAVFTFAHVVSWMLDNQPTLLFAFFFGLILASIHTVSTTLKWSVPTLLSLLGGTVGAYILVGAVPLSMPHDPLTLFFSGALAIMAMILPGISGSFVLLILGQYQYVLEAVKTFDFLTVGSVAAGAVVGIISFVRLLSWLLKHYSRPTIAILIGFMVGSLRKIWPWKQTLQSMLDSHGKSIPLVERNILPPTLDQTFWIAIGLCVLGFVVVSVLEHLQSKNNPLLRLFIRSRKRSITSVD
jgi:putative membrane protein